MSQMDTARLEELLDWLAEEVAARLQKRASPISSAPPAERVQKPDEAQPRVLAAASAPRQQDANERRVPELPAAERLTELPPLAAAPELVERSTHAAQLLSRLAIGLLVTVILINIPLSTHGTALARMIPSSASVVVRNGLLVKEADKPDVYVYQDGKFRWITDLGAFQRYGFQWKNVQTVDPGFLASYETGRPLYLIAKCPTSPHIYQLQNGSKHWIMDIPTFEAQGYQWSDVENMDCITLRSMPTGETIPPGQGPAPQP